MILDRSSIGARAGAGARAAARRSAALGRPRGSRARRPALLLGALATVPWLGCGGGASEHRPEGAGSPGDEGRWALFQAAEAAGRLELCAAAGPLRERAARLAERLASASGFRASLAASPAGDDRGAVRVVLGTLDQPAVLDLARGIGASRLPDGGFEILGRRFRAPGDLVVACFADPGRPGLPVVLAFGNDAAAAAAQLDELPLPWDPSITVRAGGDPELEVPLGEDGRPLLTELVDRASLRAEYWRGSRIVAWEGLTARIGTHPIPFRRTRDYSSACRHALERVRKWLGVEPPERVELRVYDHAEDYEAILGTLDLARANVPARRVHALLARGLPDDGGAALARLSVLVGAGEPAEDWMLDGLSVAAAGTWWGRELSVWGGHLWNAGLVPDVEELVARDAPERVDEHVLKPLRGLLLRALQRTSGSESLEAMWTGKAPLPDLAELGSALEGTLRRAAVELEPAPDRATLRTRARAAPFRDGIALYDARDPRSLSASSYAERSVEASLERARALGADSVSLTAFASLESPEPALVRLPGRAVYGFASDVALASALAAVRRQEMGTMLVVEPLSGAGGSWADGLVMTDVPKIERFFAGFSRIATHYALFGQLADVDVLCLGSNLGVASRTLVWDDGASDTVLREASLARWRELIALVRGAFHGLLTFSASSRNELDQIGFWRDLDYVGLAMYPSFLQARIPEDDRPVRRIMRREIERSLQYAELWERPMLFTQVGFPSRQGGWRRAYAAHGELDLDEQRRFYALLADILRPVRRRGALAGLFVWDWSCDPAAGGPEDVGLTPQNKPAEAELPRLFGAP